MNSIPVKILALAQEDIDRALMNIAAENPPAARDWLNHLSEILRQLSEFPYSCPQIHVGGRYIRSYYRAYVRPYAVYYRVMHETIVVMRVLHERQNAQKHLSPMQ